MPTMYPVCLSLTQEEMGGALCPTITGDHQNRITDYTAIVVHTPQRATDSTPKDLELSAQAAGTTGGGSEIIVLESNQNHATAKDTEVCTTLPASMGMGGGYVPMIVDALVFDKAQITSKLNYSRPTWGGICHPLTSAAGEAIVIIKRADYISDDPTPKVGGVSPSLSKPSERGVS